MDSEKKRITKNSLFLYLRTFLIMLVSLYTVRVTLRILGFEDYGIYNAIGGVVVVFSFLSNTLTSVSQRYFSFYIGKGDLELLQKYFNAVLMIYIIIALFVVVSAEIIGVWFLNKYLTIPDNRLSAANWVFQFSVFTLFVNFIQIPYNSIIISKERMDVYAYISIIEVCMKLAIVYLLIYIDIDSLVLYSALLFMVAVVKSGFYIIYARVKFRETAFRLIFDKKVYSELISYLGWNTFGVFATVVKKQGVVVILNVFFGAIVNAAYAIASQISNAINQFVSSFTLAVQPQIVKKYAENNTEKMFDFVFLASKFSCFLLLIVALPCIFEMPFILKLWLSEFPAHTVEFSVILIINTLIESLCIPLVTAIQSTGKIKSYNISLGGLMLLSVPLSIMAIKLGANVYATLIIALLITVASQILRLYYMVKLTNMPIHEYMRKVVLKIIYVLIPSIVLGVVPKYFLEDSTCGFIISTAWAIIFTGVFVVLFGMTKSERSIIEKILNKAKAIIHIP